jgi:hypothetical protein
MKLKPDQVEAIRPSLSSPTLLGRKAFTASDAEINAYVTGMMRSWAKVAPALRRVGEQLEANRERNAEVCRKLVAAFRT